ncbi:MAG: hypothetical protein P8R54_33705 [Myxococcota bacterium]|nr:hypothetical protein [Myxococcota bacterium]
MSEATEDIPWRSTLVLYSTLAGLCKLIPLPFIDDIIQGFVVRRMLNQILAHHDCEADSIALDRLTRERTGCPLGCLYALVLYPIKKILKKIFFFLAFKDFLDESSRWFHRGYLVQFAAQGNLLTARELSDEHRLWPVALAIEETCAETDTKRLTELLRRAFSGSRASLRIAARGLWTIGRTARKDPVPEAAVGAALEQVESDPGDLGTALEAFSTEVWKESEHLVALERRFLVKLKETAKRYQTGRVAEE